MIPARTHIPSGTLRQMVAIDCDLHSMTAVCADGTVLASRAPYEETLQAVRGHYNRVASCRCPLLYEIAGTAYARTDSRAAMHATTRWAIFNAAMASLFAVQVPADFLVATSAQWTKGIPTKERHLLTKATGKNKDIRECESMLWFYNKHPETWVPLTDYLDSLSMKGKKK